MSSLNIQIIILGIYALGCGLSQSLMSLASTLILFPVVFGSHTFYKQASRNAKLPVLLGWSLFVFLSLNLLLRADDGDTWATFGRLPLFMLPLAGLLLTRFSEVHKLEKVLFVAGGAIAIAAFRSLWEFVVHAGPGVGFFKNPIYYAYSVFPAFVFFAELWRRGISIGRFTPNIALGVSLFCLVGIFCAETRMIWLMTFIYITVLALPVWCRNKSRWLYPAFIIVGLGCVSLAYVKQPRVRLKINNSLSGNDPSLEWRKVAWRYNWQLFKDNPLFGVGAQRNSIDTDKIPSLQGHWPGGHKIYAHSIYFQALADSGSIGFLLLMVFGLSLALQNPLTGTLLLFCALSGLTENIFNNSKAMHPLFFYTLLSLWIGRWAPQRGLSDSPLS